MKIKLPKSFISSTCFLISTLVTTSQEFHDLKLKSKITHVQPMTGIVFWADNEDDLTTLGDKVQLEFSYLIFSDIIQQKNRYNWSIVDELLTKAANNGRQAIIRFRYTYPGETKISVPNYIVNSSNYNKRIKNIEGRNTFIPDWSNQELMDFTLEFYTKFSERYDNDPRLAFLQIGFGSYSEYHLYDGPKLVLGDNFPSKTYQTVFLNHINTVFSETPWSLSIDSASSEYTPMSSNSALRALNFGLFDDSFLHKDHSTSDNEYNRKSWLFYGANRADTRVAGGELNYYSQYDQEHVLNEEGPYGVTFEAMASMYNISYMIGNDQLKYQTTDRIEAVSLSTGYHFEVTKFKTNGTITELEIINKGIAPIYYDAYPIVNGIRASLSLKGLKQGKTRSFIINTIGTNQSLVIDSDRLVSGQEIQFDADLESGTLSIDTFLEASNYINLYPNPFNEELVIKNNNNLSIEISIFNLLGCLVKKELIVKTTHINTSNLNQGTYLVQVSLEGKLFKNKLFIKP